MEAERRALTFPATDAYPAAMKIGYIPYDGKPQETGIHRGRVIVERPTGAAEQIMHVAKLVVRNAATIMRHRYGLPGLIGMITDGDLPPGPGVLDGGVDKVAQSGP